MTTDEVKAKLQSLQDDPTMKTVSKYSPTAPEWPDNRLPFVEIHLAYLRTHKLVNPIHYISNLELMIKKR
jgi:hypothetical protein